MGLGFFGGSGFVLTFSYIGPELAGFGIFTGLLPAIVCPGA